MPDPWYLAPQALAPLASLAANPPHLVRRPAPLAQWFAGGAEHEWVHDPDDARVEALRRLADAAFIAAEAEGGCTATLAGPRLCDVVRAAASPGVGPLSRRIAAALAPARAAA